MSKDVYDYLRKYLTEMLCSFLSESKGSKKSKDSKTSETFSEPQSFKQDLPNLSGLKISYYFASNKRFFTNSRQLQPPKIKEPMPDLPCWTFVGSWYVYDIPEWILEATGVVITFDDSLNWRVERVTIFWKRHRP